MKQGLFDYNDMAFEKSTLKLEVEGLSDDILLDECNFILSGQYESEIMENVLLNYFKNGKISKEERILAEGLYLLAHGDLAWEV